MIKLHDKELHNMYSSPNIQCDEIKEDEIGGTCSMNGGVEKCVQRFSRKF
jgi:hypothetical protein